MSEYGCGDFRMPAIGRCRVGLALLWEFVKLVSSVHPEMLSADSDTTLPLKPPSPPFTHPRGLDSWKFQSSESNYTE